MGTLINHWTDSWLFIFNKMNLYMAYSIHCTLVLHFLLWLFYTLKKLISINRLDLVKNRLDIGLFIPTIKVEAKYDLKGNLLLLPLVGVGDAKLYLSECILIYIIMRTRSSKNVKRNPDSHRVIITWVL